MENKYNIPEGWESVIPDLIENGLLQESPSGFEVSKENQQILTGWISANWKTITRLMEYYGNNREQEGSSNLDKEREIAKSLNF